MVYQRAVDEFLNQLGKLQDGKSKTEISKIGNTLRLHLSKANAESNRTTRHLTHEFMLLVLSHKMIASFERECEFWTALSHLCRLHTSSPTPSATNASELYRNANLSAYEFFKVLLDRVVAISDSEKKNLCILGLKRLIVESKKPVERRNQNLDFHFWRTDIHPFLKQNRLLDDFSENNLMKSKLQFYFQASWIPANYRSQTFEKSKKR